MISFFIFVCVTLGAAVARAEEAPTRSTDCCCATFVRDLRASCRWVTSSGGASQCDIDIRYLAEKYTRIFPVSDPWCQIIMSSGSADVTAIRDAYCRSKKGQACEKAKIPSYKEVRIEATWPSDGMYKDVDGKRCCGDCCEGD